MAVAVAALLAGCGTGVSTDAPAATATGAPGASPSPILAFPTSVTGTASGLPAQSSAPSASIVAPTPIPANAQTVPPPSPVATSSPAARGWPAAIDDSWGGEPPFAIGSDGTAYAWTNESGQTAVLAALDPAGRMKPGWPFLAPQGSVPVSLAVASNGSVLAGTFDEASGEFALHRIGPDGREVAGWPLRTGTTRGCWPVVEGPGKTVYVGSCLDGPATLEIAALDPAGRVTPGWPVRLEDERLRAGTWDPAIQVATDGTVYALVASGRGWDPAARLWALSADGRTRPGWPASLTASDAGFRVAPGGRVVVGSYLLADGPPGSLDCLEADATVITELDARGRTVAGWPRREKGWATLPIVAEDGTLYYFVGDRAVARRPDGSVRAGWPARIPGLRPECGFTGPVLGPDGTVFIAADRLRAYDPDGDPRPGWPFVPDGGLAGWPCATVAIGGPAPAIGADGTVYVATRAPSADAAVAGQAEITALDPRGRILAGWPVGLPFAWGIGAAGDYLGVATGLRPGGVYSLAGVGGWLYATTRECGAAWAGTMLSAFARDGTIAE